MSRLEKIFFRGALRWLESWAFQEASCFSQPQARKHFQIMFGGSIFCAMLHNKTRLLSAMHLHSVIVPPTITPRFRTLTVLRWLLLIVFRKRYSFLTVRPIFFRKIPPIPIWKTYFKREKKSKSSPLLVELLLLDEFLLLIFRFKLKSIMKSIGAAFSLNSVGSI